MISHPLASAVDDFLFPAADSAGAPCLRHDALIVEHGLDGAVIDPDLPLADHFEAFLNRWSSVWGEGMPCIRYGPLDGTNLSTVPAPTIELLSHFICYKLFYFGIQIYAHLLKKCLDFGEVFSSIPNYFFEKRTLNPEVF